jgi:hypothetical protein
MKMAIHSHLIINLKMCGNLYSSPSIIRMIKSRRKRWAGHVEGIRVE